MKRRLLILVGALAACSPAKPSAMDAQFAMEAYYADQARRADPYTDVIGRCAAIAAFSVLSSDGDSATVAIAFASQSGDGDGKDVAGVELRLRKNSGSNWYIPADAELPALPCKALAVPGPGSPRPPSVSAKPPTPR